MNKENIYNFCHELAESFPLLLLENENNNVLLPGQWNKLYRLLLYHGLIPFFVHFKGHTYFKPEENIKRYFIQKTKEITADNLKKIVIQKELEKLFNQGDFLFLFIKGLQLSKLLYHNPTIRPLIDIDILIDRKEETAIRNMLLKNGAEVGAGLQNKFIQNISLHDVPLHFKDVIVELHHDILINKKYDSISSFFRDATETIELDGEQMQILSQDYYLLFLCFHAHKHLNSGKIKLLWYIDIACMLYSYNFSEKQLKEIGKMADEMNIKEHFHYSLALISKYFIHNFDFPFCVEESELKVQSRIFLKLIRSDSPDVPVKYYLKNWKRLNLFNKIRYILGILFPGISYIKNKYQKKTKLEIYLLFILNPVRVFFKILFYPVVKRIK